MKIAKMANHHFCVPLCNSREFKQSTTAAVTKKSGRVRLGGLLNFKFSKAKYKETRAKEFKPSFI